MPVCAGTAERLASKLPFQYQKLLVQCGLGDIELLARLGKAEGGCNIIENFIQFVIDIHGSSFLSERCSEPFCSVLTIIIRPAYKTVK